MSFSRRHFIRQAACAAVGTTSIASTVWNLRGINAAAAQSLDAFPDPNASETRALVCLFLYGGNDANNMVIPRDDATYATYAAARGALALSKNSLLPINPLAGDGRDYGFHPSMPELQALFNNDRKLAVLANVGTLAVPTTRAQYLAKSVPLPPQLFSHADQQIEWQTSWPDQPAKTGWGGRLADLVTSFNKSDTISMSISLAGTNQFQVGQKVFAYQVTPTGSVGISNTTGGYNPARYQAFQSLLNLPHQNLFEAEFAKITQRGIANNTLLSGALNGITINTPFPTGSSLSSQLQMIAKVIAARKTLNMRRQVFFCSVGGYDTHSNELASHTNLLAELSQCISAFYKATVELGIADRVTLFTASDFGRTFQSNGAGSDHGWGSHALVVGGSVRGGNIFGKYPTIAFNGPDDVGEGRWVPSTSVDEYSATLAKWFGVSNSNELTAVLPNIGRFASPDLGFLNPLGPPAPAPHVRMGSSGTLRRRQGTMRITRQAQPWFAVSVAIVILLIVGFLFLRPAEPPNAPAAPVGRVAAPPQLGSAPPAAAAGSATSSSGGSATTAATPSGAPRTEGGTATSALVPGEATARVPVVRRPRTLAGAPELEYAFANEPQPPNAAADGFQLTAGAANPDLVAVVGTVRDFRAAIGENPVGNNAEITRALLGDNSRRAQFLEPNTATNARGEMLDRWGHPYYFHGISRTEMEVHSAGPDGVMWTEDDQVFR